MRIISVIGILLLLTLQYFWVKNAYDSVEQDILGICKDCLKEAVDVELFERIDKSKVKVRVDPNYKMQGPDSKIIANTAVNQASDINLKLQDCMEQIGFSCSKKSIDTVFHKIILTRLKFLPEYSMQIIDDSTNLSDRILENHIFVKLNSKQSIELVLLSSVSSVVKKARYIFAISLILMLLIAIILTFQFISMTKDKEFTAFIKDFTRNLAHEMRTPVNDIYMLTTRLMSGSITDTEKIAIYQKESLNQCSKLLLAVDNVLLVAKSEQTKILIVKSKVNVPDYIEYIVEKYRNN